MAKVVWGDVFIGAGVGAYNYFAPDLMAKLPAVGPYAARIIQFGPAVAGIAMTMLDWQEDLGGKLTLAGTPQATEALLGMLVPKTAAQYGRPSPPLGRAHPVSRVAVGAAPEPTERRGL